MARFTPEEVTHAVELNNRGYNLPEIAAFLGRDSESLRSSLKLRGIKLTRYYRPAHNAKDCDEEALVADFMGGMSVLSLSSKYDITRSGVEARLKRNGLSARDRSTANKVSMALMPKEHRKQRVKSAHDAVRGRKASHEEKVAHALTLYRTKNTSHGPGEPELASILQVKQIPFETQYPVDIHNIDLLVFESVAVEVTTQGVNRFRSEDYRKRSEKVVKAGFHFLGVVLKNPYAVTLNADDLVTDIKALSRLPPERGQYRVVRCSYYTSTSNHFKPHKASAIDPSVQPVYARYESEAL